LFPPPVEIRQEKFKFKETPLRTDFIRGLLKKTVKERLGYNGFQKDIQQHPWLGDIDWLKVIRRELKPEFIPDPNQQNYDFGAALEELLYEGSPLTKNPVRKRKLHRNKPTLAHLWNEENAGQKSSRSKLEEELDYIEEYFESYVKPPAESNPTLTTVGQLRKEFHNNSINSAQNSSTNFSSLEMTNFNEKMPPVLRKPVVTSNNTCISYTTTSIEDHIVLDDPHPMPPFFPMSKSSMDLETLMEELKPMVNGEGYAESENSRLPISCETVKYLKDNPVTRRISPDTLNRRTPSPIRALTPPLRRGTPDRKFQLQLLKSGTPPDIPARTHSAASTGSDKKVQPDESKRMASLPIDMLSPIPAIQKKTAEPFRRKTSGQAYLLPNKVKPRPLDIFNNKANQLDLVFPSNESSSPSGRKSYLSPEFVNAESPSYEIESYFD
jgi:hypothetical protein